MTVHGRPHKGVYADSPLSVLSSLAGQEHSTRRSFRASSALKHCSNLRPHMRYSSTAFKIKSILEPIERKQQQRGERAHDGDGVGDG